FRASGAIARPDFAAQLDIPSFSKPRIILRAPAGRPNLRRAARDDANTTAMARPHRRWARALFEIPNTLRPSVSHDRKQRRSRKNRVAPTAPVALQPPAKAARKFRAVPGN